MQVKAIIIMPWDMDSAPVKSIVQSLIIRVIITLIILLAEAIVYRVLQSRLDRPKWVWTHIVSLFIIIILIPLLTVLFNFFVVDQIGNGTAFEWARKANLIRNILFWSAVAIGHLFFTLTIVRGFSKKGNEEINNSADVLDEFDT